MAVDAVHAPALAFRQLIGRHPVDRIFADVAQPIAQLHIGDDLALVVGRDVLDFVGDVHVPVDAGGDCQALASTADVHFQGGNGLAVLFIIGILVHAPDDVAMKLLGPVALLAHLARRPQVLHRRRYRTRIGVERDREHLARP